MKTKSRKDSDKWATLCRECKSRTRACREGKQCHLLQTLEEIASQSLPSSYILSMAELSQVDGIDDEE